MIEPPQSFPRLLRLHAADNVFVAATALAAGEQVVIEGRRFQFQKPIALGYKIAARDIAAGEKIIKYGAPIGSATRWIEAGEDVHLHNMQSDYLPTYEREGGARFVHEN